MSKKTLGIFTRDKFGDIKDKITDNKVKSTFESKKASILKKMIGAEGFQGGLDENDKKQYFQLWEDDGHYSIDIVLHGKNVASVKLN